MYSGQKKKYYNHKLFFGLLLNSIYHCILCVFIPLLFFENTSDLNHNGSILLWDLGCVIFTLITFVANMKMIFIINKVTRFIMFITIFSDILWIFTIFCISMFKNPLFENGALYMVLYRLVITPVFVFFVIIIIIYILVILVVYSNVYVFVYIYRIVNQDNKERILPKNTSLFQSILLFKYNK